MRLEREGHRRVDHRVAYRADHGAFRRRALAAGAFALFCGPAQAAVTAGEWTRFRSRFLTDDGRLLDTGNGGISHSEGQGWGMMFALAHDDRATFRLIHGWTRRVLGRRTDALFSWRFRPAGNPPVDDPNNATDGDLYIAWALVRAGQRWGDPALVEEGAAIGRDVLRLLTREAGGLLLLLPGAAGFEDAQRTVVNPSYLVLPAYAALDEVVRDRRWRQLAADGLTLLRQARFGRWGLPPDWLAIDRQTGRLAPAEGWPPRFSYDAVRVPLLLAWSGNATEPAAVAAARFWTDRSHAQMPAWTDLATGATSPYAASGGIRAVAQLAAERIGAAPPAAPAQLDPSDDYYSAALKMLSRLARAEGLR
jgi:endoglucanase